MAHKLPNCLVCCKKGRRERGIQKARAALDKELDVLELVKSMRFFRMAIKRLLSADEINKLKEQSQFETICPDGEAKFVASQIYGQGEDTTNHRSRSSSLDVT